MTHNHIRTSPAYMVNAYVTIVTGLHGQCLRNYKSKAPHNSLMTVATKKLGLKAKIPIT